MPADTRSSGKAKHSDGQKQKEKGNPSEDGSGNASGSKSYTRETTPRKSSGISPSSLLRSGRQKNGNYQPPNPSPLRRSERARSTSNSEKSDTSTSLTNATRKSLKRKKSVKEVEANHVEQHAKRDSYVNSQGKKPLCARRYRDFFIGTNKFKASDSANKRRVGPSTCSNGGGCNEKIPVVDEDDLKEQGLFGEAFPETTSKSGKGVSGNIMPEVASETPKVLSSLNNNSDPCDVEGPQADPDSIELLRSSNSGGCRENVPVADEDSLKEQGICGEAFAESTSKSDNVILENVLQEVASETPNVPSLLDHNNDSCDVEVPQADPESITLLREKVSPFIDSGPKSGFPRHVEYWVPVQMSNAQLELYCSSLLTNSTALCSKSDPLSLLHEILISTRKCCDHPIIIEKKLQDRLHQGIPPAKYLDVDVEACGKLYFLDTILTKIKDQGKKVIILYKTLGESGRDIIGGLLDDYFRLRFGIDCYERVDAGGLSLGSKRQASVDRFNKEKRFVFLLETRACSPSIKLSSIDAVVIFGSDWNPLNDLKALKKIKIDSESEVKVFRLYTFCSIEEKVLLLSKKSISLESTSKGFGFSTNHKLLSWGAPYLFKKLDEFHDSPGDPKILSCCSDLNNVGEEFLSLLQTHGTHLSTKCISNARQNDGSYYTDKPLLGEQYNEFKDEDQHRLLWRKLLEGRQPKWIYLSISSQRNRKRVQLHVETSEINAHIDDTVKRRKKNEKTILEPCAPIVVKDVEKEPASVTQAQDSATNGPELSPKSGCSNVSAQKMNAEKSSDKSCSEQNDLHQMLKPDMERLFQILNLKEDIQQKAEQFLVFVIANQRVIREPHQLQAFLISVCWVAASILKENLDHAESLSIARKHLNFNCDFAHAEYSFSKMQFPMKMFLRSEGAKLQAQGSNASNSKQKHIGGEEKKSEYIDKMVRRVAKLINRQKSEENEIKKWWYESKAKLEKYFKLESAVIRSIYSAEAVRMNKLKRLEANHRKMLEELESEFGSRINSLKAKHKAERKAKEEEAILKMNEIPAKSFSSSRNDLEEANSKEHAKNSSTAEVAANYADREDGDISKSKSANQINNGLDVQGMQYPSAVAAEEFEQIATSKNDPLSAENPTLQQVSDANEMEQHDEASSSTHLESLNSPSTLNPSVAVPVSQEHETSSGRLNPLNNEDVRAETSRDVPSSDHSDGMPCNTSEQAEHIHLPPDSTSPVDSALSHPVELTQPCPTESTIPCRTPEAPIQEDHRPLNMSVEAAPLYILNAHPPLQNSNQFQNYTPLRSFPSSSLPPSQVFDPLQKEYERVCGESNQVTRNHEDMVSHLNSECDKEIEERVGQIQRKYDAMVHEADASFLQKKRELERIQLKVAMNMKLAEAFRCKCVDHTQRGFSSAAKRSPAAAPTPLPPLPEIARNFEAWNLTEYEASLDVRGRQQQQQQQRLARPTDVVCLPDDE